MAARSDKSFDGYAVAYDREEIQFPVYVLAVGSVALLVGAFLKTNVVLLLLGFVLGCMAYHNYPLLETGRPRLAANRDGLSIEGLGVLRWRAIERIDLIPVVIRAMTYQELEVSLRQTLDSALAADWRRRPAHRVLMRLPWSMRSKNAIRIPLDIFDEPPDKIHRMFLSIWQYNRGP
jgi:hypothetical protein